MPWEVRDGGGWCVCGNVSVQMSLGVVESHACVGLCVSMHDPTNIY